MTLYFNCIVRRVLGQISSPRRLLETFHRHLEADDMELEMNEKGRHGFELFGDCS